MEIRPPIWSLASHSFSMAVLSMHTMSMNSGTGGPCSTVSVESHISGAISDCSLQANQVVSLVCVSYVWMIRSTTANPEEDWDSRNLLYYLRFNVTAAYLIPGSNYREK